MLVEPGGEVDAGVHLSLPGFCSRRQVLAADIVDPTHRVNPSIEQEQCQRLAALRSKRDNQIVNQLRDRLTSAAQSDDNLMPLLITCVENDMTLGEICNTLRDVWGEYRPEQAI